MSIPIPLSSQISAVHRAGAILADLRTPARMHGYPEEDITDVRAGLAAAGVTLEWLHLHADAVRDAWGKSRKETR